MINEILEIGRFILDAYRHSWIYILVTIPLAVAVNLSGLSGKIKKVFAAKPVIAILLATIVGAFSPFCSCGVIPVISALLIGGVPVAPVMAFWLASPSMDPEVFFLSVSQVGMSLAVWRLAGTFLLSLGAGYITHFLVQSGWIKGSVLLPKLLKNSKNSSSAKDACGCGHSDQQVRPLTDSSEALAADKQGATKQSTTATLIRESAATECQAPSCSSEKKRSRTQKITRETGKILLMVLKFMTLAYFLEAFIIRYIPSELIVNLLGSENVFAIPLSALVAVPMYTTNLTALGLISGLLNQGMSGGAALAFLIGGATTTIPAMAAVYGIVKKRIFLLYVGFALGGSLLFGFLYQVFQIFF